MIRHLAIISLVLFSLNIYAQDIDFTFEVTPELEVCQESVSFEAVAINNTGATLFNPTIEVQLPTGIIYELASLTEITTMGMAEYDVSSSAALQFTCNDLPVGDSIKFEIRFSAKMDALAFQESGGVFRNNVGIVHDDGFEFSLSESYNILYPALNILDLTPFSQSILSGDTTTRSFKIVNAGFGKTDQIYITDFFTTGATLLSTNVGTVSGDTITLVGTDFTGIGNGDAYFDNNESITIVETITGYSCTDITSSSVIQSFWGCEETFDYSATNYAHVSVDFQSPALKLIASEDLNACFGTGVASQQQLKITNTGSGIASDILLDIYKSSGSGYDETIYSKFDEGTFLYRLGEAGSPVSILPTTAIATDGAGAYACLGDAPIGRVVLDLPDLSPGDTLIVEWDMYSCCIDVCENNKIKGWKAEVDYTDVCEITDYTKALTGQGINSQLMSFFTETPTDIYDATSETYTFIVSSFENSLPENEFSNYEVEFTLEEGLVYEAISFYSNGTNWDPFSVDYDLGSNTVTAIFPTPIPFTLPKSELELVLSGDCGTGGWKTIEMNVSYNPDSTCESTCMVPLECNLQVETYLHCPLIDCEGLKFVSFDAVRTSYGLPDNDYDGLADGTGALDMDKIKLNRAMVTDTIQTIAIAEVNSSGATWDYSKLISTNDEGINLSFISANVIIYDASAGIEYTIPLSVSESSISGNEKTFELDLSTTNLITLNPALIGYTYSNLDSIKVYSNYVVISSVNGLVKETTWENEFYVSEIAEPSEEDKLQCDEHFARTTLIGYSWRNDNGNNNSVKSCSKNVSQNFGLSIGDCCSNYAGGNLFPHEYRQWGYVKEAKVVIPDNYELVSTLFRQYRTRNTNARSTQTVSSIVPDFINGDTLFYDLEQYYLSGAIKYSDDGFNGILQVKLAPNCDVPQGVYEPIEWYFNYQKSTDFGGDETGYIDGDNDNIRYIPSNLNLSSNSPWVDANTREVSWNLKIQNTSSADADYTWVHLDAPENLAITSVVDNASGEALTMSSDIYLVGTVNDGSTKSLTINGTITNCDTLLYDVYAGYECVGYPENFESFTCNISETVLYVEPKPSDFQVRLFSEPIIGDACSPLVEVGLDVSSVKIAHMYDMQINMIVTDTNKIRAIADSSYFKYNMSNPYVSIDDPDLTDSTYSYIINDYDADFELQGIPGVTDLNNNRYKLKTTLLLGETFVPGDYVQFKIDGKNACATDLPTIYLDYDPSTKFLKDNTAGLNVHEGNTWSASWGDYDNDGFEDLFVPNKANDKPNTLYHNNGDGTMTKVTTGAIVTDLGESVSGTWGDYDNDGDLDLFVANNTYSKNKLYQNNGDGTFTSITDDPIVDLAVYSHSASWGDYDNDGYLDMVVSDIHATHFNFLFHNKGDGSFEEVTTSVISQTASSGLGVSWADYDNDGDLDVFIANTNGENNNLYRNDAGVFTAVTTGEIVNDGGHSIGGVWGDYDNDGDLDLFVSNSRDVEPNFFYENNGDGTFTKLTSGVILSNISNSHGASWMDYDNDGDLDLLVANDQSKRNFMFTNNGDKTFTKITNAITEEESNSYGTAWADYDNDGDYDLHIANHGDATNDFFINEKGACNSYFGIKLEGCNSNKSGIGARIHLKATIGGEDVWQMREISSQTSALGGQNSLKTIFGLKDATIVDSLEIRWPSGLIQVLTDQSVNQIITINEECGSKICGTVFYDENGNDIQDDGEAGIPNREILITPGNVRVSTDNNGYYQVYTTDGTYTIALLPDTDWLQTYPISEGTYTVETTSAVTDVYCGNDFGNTAICTNPDLSLSLGTTAFRRGLTNDLTVTVENEGAYNTTGVIELQLKFSDNTYLIGEEWDAVSEEDGYRTYSFFLPDLDFLSDTTITLIDSVDALSDIDDIVTLDATLLYDGDECDETNNEQSVFDVVVGSIDPNDKQVIVLDKGMVNQAGMDDTIIYKIRFQNVGNYAARRVLIVDTLSQHLDWSTIQLLESSHPFSVSINENVITWVNNNIELPDSSSDQSGSNGSVSFMVLPKKGSAPFTIVNNKAYIQFDYNHFIETNNTEIVLTPAAFLDNESVFIYPNPASGETTLTILDENNFPVEIVTVEVSNAQGTTVFFEATNTEKFKFDVSELRSGAYTITISDNDGNYYNGRLIVQ